MHELDLGRLEESVAKRISKLQYGDAMVRIKSFVEQVINDPESVAAVFASRELDALCSRLASVYYGHRREPGSEGRGTVILASELVRAGGHVELIKDYLALGLFESPVRVALSDLFNRMDRSTIEEWESLLGCEVFIAEDAGLDGKLDALDAQISEWNPSTILTLAHNQDVVCVVAAHFPGATRRYYIHHGDHHLSLGVTCEAFEHVDLHNMSYELCKHEIGVQHQHYWPLTAVRPSRIKTEFLERGALTTASCGRMSKFEAGTYAFCYERAVALMLKATRGYHVHIGELTADFMQKIHAELDAENVSHDRFIHVEWVPSLCQALIEHAVDVYVASFPIGGGKALIEALSIGLPVVTHASYRSRYHSSFDLTYPESFVWSGYEELVEIFGRWNEALVKEQAALALQYFERYYSKEAFLKAFADGRNADADVPPLHLYHGNRLQTYLDIRRMREQVLGPLESENKRILTEWANLHAAYEEHSATILRQQLDIERLSNEKNTLAMKLLEQQAAFQQARDEELARSWKSKAKKLLYVMHANKKS
ncbi:hypothetical protein G3N95_13245 [Paraburkholderia sp. Tr-20389]|uniref:hypothetical protein n=1 Tax=Paraburkholderia sp. Tr-20389 TaxID=2703903 RepID=UPI001981FB9E|nr:hypothetical protein [Paraburkholderia sp. Tr-20389]MBN3753910.1 hypothetical protein [Paraburkholderia sp. Tr-20389]